MHMRTQMTLLPSSRQILAYIFYNCLQPCLCAIGDSLQTQKVFNYSFNLSDPVNITLAYHLEDIPQANSRKYLRIIYYNNSSWCTHIEY